MIVADGKPDKNNEHPHESLPHGNVTLTNIRVIKQSTLTADCLLIQMNGASACTNCECLNKPRLCGGMKLREKYGVPAPVTRKIKPNKETL